MWNGNIAWVAKSHSCASLDVLSKGGSHSCTCQNIRWLLSCVCQEKHSPVGGVEIQERVRTAEEDGSFFCLLVDLFSFPVMKGGGKRELKVIHVYSVTSDHMVCSVPCVEAQQLGRPGAPRGSE